MIARVRGVMASGSRAASRSCVRGSMSTKTGRAPTAAIAAAVAMKEFGTESGDPVLTFCEDWMLADEVTHVKMGSDWLRRLTEKDPERRERALEFQRTVDAIFNLGGFRGEDDENPIQLARNFRRLAGFTEDENDSLAALARQSTQEAQQMAQMATAALDAQAQGDS